MLAEGKQWFDRYLRGIQPGPDESKPVVLAATASARVARLPGLPRTTTQHVVLNGTGSVAASGKVQRLTKPLVAPLEVFGAPTVRVTVTALGGWSRVVAVLSARTKGGQETVVAGGGVALSPGKSTVSIKLVDQATFVPKGARLVLTLASSSLAQNPANLLYLDLPMAATARATIGTATLAIPALRSPVSR
jgi:predicted acyl esterase